MNNQSTLSRNPRESLDITSQRNAAGSTPGALQPPGIYDRFTDAKTAIIGLIKNTTWTSKSSKAQKSLLQTVNSLANIPENTAELSAGEMRAMEDFMRTLEDVRESLKAASTKYGTKDARKRDKAKKLWTNLGGDGGLQVLETCRTNIETAVNRLQNIHEPLPTEASTQNVPSSGQDSQVKGESRLSSNLSIAKSTFDMVEAVSDTIPLVGSYIGAAAKLGSTIVEMWQGMDSNKEAAKRLESRMTMLAKDLEYFKSKPQENQKEQTNKRIRNLQLELKSVGEEIKALNSKGAVTKAFLSRDNAEILKGFEEQIKATEDEIHRLVSFDTNELLNKIYEHTLLARLGGGSYGEHGHRMKDAICLEGTRQGILQRIGDWAQDASSHRVLWISGMAGRGKSTIAATVAHRLSNQSAWALFHFRRGQTALEKRLVCALAKQLESRGTPEVTLAILQAIQEKENIAEERLDKQFEALLINPLKDYPLGLPPIVLIVDALDECEDSTYATSFIELIDEYSSSLPRNVKFILTTRPEHPLVDVLRSKEWRTESLDHTTPEIHHDVELFIRSELSKIKSLKDGLPADWPSKYYIQKLVASSEGLFQWARTAVKHIGGGSPDYRLKELLQDSSKLRGLDGLYSQILSNAFAKAEESSRVDLLHRTLAALVAAPYPISLEVLAYLFSGQGILRNMTGIEACAFMCDDVLPYVASLLFIPPSTAEPIQLMHTSIRDLLIDVKRCGNSPYSINLPQAHWDLSRDCFRLMERDLKKNICNLSDLSKPNSDPDVQACVASEVPAGLQYCCRSWAIHFRATHESEWNKREPMAITNDLQHFSKTNLLCWLEVMSLIGRVGEAIAMAKQTEQQMVTIAGDMDIWLPTLWNDAHRVMVEFLEAISFGTLHIYASALPFCPIGTQLWKYYHDHSLTKVLGGQQKRKWSTNLWARDVNRQVNSISFSTNGKILALGLDDGTVCLWDAEKGEQLGEPMQGHTGQVISVAFSPDGKRLASGSHDNTVRLWDAEKGEQLGEPMLGHSNSVISVAFSPDGKRLASGSWDNTVRLWDAEKGEQLGEPMQGHTWVVSSVAFSPDGKRLASGSQDNTVRLWDAEKGEQLGEPMQGHTQRVTSVAFSPDGKRLASGSWDHTVRLWDAEKGEQLGEPMQGHTWVVSSVAFSPDGKRLASGSHDKTVRLWDAEKGEQLGEPMQGHTGQVTSVAFSPDGKRLASGSHDKMVRLWDAEKVEQLGEPMQGHSDWVASVAFSPDGKRLASGSDDNTVRLWDAEKGEQLGEPMQGHTGQVISVAFSPDGKRLASGSHDNTVRLWDAEKGEQLGEPMLGHSNSVISVAFSPDGKRLASGSWDNTVRLWDAEKGEQLGEPMQGHTWVVSSVAFSPDGKRLASGSQDNTVRLWDAEKGEQLGEPMQGHTGQVISVAFSPDGKRLASGSHDNTVRLWDAEKGEQLGEPMLGHSNSVISVAFSPDGKRLASGSWDNTVRLWDAEKGEQLGEPMQGHTWVVSSVAFSPDGKRLASGSQDNTVRLWDAEKGEQLGEPMQGHTQRVTSVAFSPDGKRLAVRSQNNQLSWFSAFTLEPLHNPPRPINHTYKNFPPPFSPFSSHSPWVTYLGSKFLWLPVQYWDSENVTIVLSGDILLVTGGKISFFDISKILQFCPLAA